MKEYRFALAENSCSLLILRDMEILVELEHAFCSPGTRQECIEMLEFILKAVKEEPSDAVQ